MKALLSRIEQKVLKPAPLRNFSLGALEREEARLEGLIASARAANRRGFEALSAERDRKVKDGMEQARKSLGVSTLSHDQLTIVIDEALKDGPHIRLDQDYVIGKPLLERLALRLALCRSEIARKHLKRRIKRD